MCTYTCINHICIKFFYLLFQNFRQKMDYFKEIKSSLEENDCLNVLCKSGENLLVKQYQVIYF